MNTATVTWINYENNGTYLQAYALQQVINKLGHNNVIIDDKHILEQHKVKPNINFYIYKVYSWLRSVFNHQPISAAKVSHRFYQEFRSRHLNIYQGSDYENKFDAYICGSDQIWSPYLPFIGYYYLDFTSKLKIAYAPSVGTSKCGDEYLENVKRCLDSFSFISTRERVGKEVLSKLTDKPVKEVLDPTLLLTRTDWEELVKTNDNSNDKYLFCYFLSTDQWYVNYAIEYARKHKLKVIVFYTDSSVSRLQAKIEYGGPEEFLSLIHSAYSVFTDSFHATVFSLLFHRRFITFKRFKDGGERDQNARLYNLLTPINLTSRFIGETDCKNIDKLPPINYEEIENSMDVIRNDSLNYLKIALEQ